jgi:hypothetical protein
MKMTQTGEFQLRQLGALRETVGILFGQVLLKNILKLATPLGAVAGELVKIMLAVKSGDFSKLSKDSKAVAKGITEAFDVLSRKADSLLKTFYSMKENFNGIFGDDALSKLTKWGIVLGVIAAAAAPFMLLLGGGALALSGFLGLLTGIGTVISGIIGTIAGLSWPIWIAIGAVLIFKKQLWGVFEGLTLVANQTFSVIIDTISATGAELSAAFGGPAQESMNLWIGFGAWLGKTVGTLAVWIIQLGTYGVIAAQSIVDAFKTAGESIGHFFAALWVFILNGLATVVRMIVHAADALNAPVPRAMRDFATTKLTSPKFERAVIEKAGPRSIVEQVARRGAMVAEKEGKAGGGFLDTLKELMESTKDSSVSSANAAEAAAKAAAAAKEAAGKPVNVNVDGREVARANTKHQQEIQTRTGFELTPWQRRVAVDHGAVMTWFR